MNLGDFKYLDATSLRFNLFPAPLARLQRSSRSKMSRLFSIIGDSNIRRNMTGLNVASRESMKTAQIIDCTTLPNIDNSFHEVRAESEVLILAAITDFLISGGNCGTIFSTIDPILATFTTKVMTFCAFRPNLQVHPKVHII